MGTVPTPANPGAGTILTSTQTGTWYNTQSFLLQPPSCRVHITTDTSVSAGTTSSISWNTEDWDYVQAGDSGMHSATTNPERITIRTAGRYRVAIATSLTASSNAAARVSIAKNGTAVDTHDQSLPTASAGYMATLSDEIQCSVGDYLTLQVSAISAAVTARGTITCYMVVTWVSN